MDSLWWGYRFCHDIAITMNQMLPLCSLYINRNVLTSNLLCAFSFPVSFPGMNDNQNRLDKPNALTTTTTTPNTAFKGLNTTVPFAFRPNPARKLVSWASLPRVGKVCTFPHINVIIEIHCASLGELKHHDDQS